MLSMSKYTIYLLFYPFLSTGFDSNCTVTRHNLLYNSFEGKAIRKLDFFIIYRVLEIETTSTE